MMKPLLMIFMTISFTALHAQQGSKVILGNIDTIHSEILHEKRTIWVYTPDITNGQSLIKKKYPVVYVLDGDHHFYSVTGIIQQLSAANGNMVLPQMIVVGVLNTDRTRDFTSSRAVADDHVADSLVLGKAGGGEDFISFMEKELIPYVDSAYPTQPYRVLIGHSLAGLPVISSLINHTALFNGYIAIDPSIWWDHEKLLNESAVALAKNQYVNTGFFLGIANSMEGANDTNLVKRDTSRLSGQIRSNLKFAKVISGNKQNKLKSKWVYYNQEDHESVPLIATYDALHFIFDFYKLKLTQQDLADTTDALATKIELHYQKVSEQMGYSIYPPEDLVSKLGYKAIEEKQWTRAVSLFKMNTDYYPASFTAFDALGDFYAATGNIPNAVACYRKALSLNPQELTKTKLDKLEHQ